MKRLVPALALWLALAGPAAAKPVPPFAPWIDGTTTDEP